jgi:hypothetical protein
MSRLLIVRFTGFLVGVLVVVALMVLVASAYAGVSRPAWGVLSTSNPTAFSWNDDSAACVTPGESCDAYHLQVTNVGGAPSDGSTVTVTDMLPDGVRPGPGNHFVSGKLGSIEFRVGNPEVIESWGCTTEEVAGRWVVTCSFPFVVDALAQTPVITIPVVVEPPPRVEVDRLGENVVSVTGGGAAEAKTSQQTLLNPSSPTVFGVADLANSLVDRAGVSDSLAAGHPHSMTTSLDVTSGVAPTNRFEAGTTNAVEDVKDVMVDLPVGLVGNPQAVGECPIADLVGFSTTSNCPRDSQVGVVTFNQQGGFESNQQDIPLYSMEPARGFPAELGFEFAEHPAILYVSAVGVGAGVHVRASANVFAASILGFQGAGVTLFGDPKEQDGGVPLGEAFFINPSQCTGSPLITTLNVDSWENPAPSPPLTPSGSADYGALDLSNPAWKSATTSTPAVEGCDLLTFEPTLSFRPESQEEEAAGEPAGYETNLAIPQGQITNPNLPATPDLKKAVLTLPEGAVVNPSAANGLEACSPSEIDLASNTPPTCPDASKIGTVQAKTPLLKNTLPGSIYLAEQDNNPFGTLLALYLVVDDPVTGVVVKIPGEVKPGPATGRLTVTFDNNPQVPIEDVKVSLTKGPRAQLINPNACGTYATSTALTPWSAPQSGPPFVSDTSFAISQGCHGPQFSPAFTAGTLNSQAGAFSPFTLTFSRTDQDQGLSGVTVQTPPGFAGVIKGVPECPEPQAQAGTCEAGSLIGHTTAGAGAGPDPFYVGGNVYLTGPYKGAPFGLSIVVPAIAGPFNLGNVIVRAAIEVNSTTAQITVVSDPLPTILQGIPLDVRTVNVTIDRPGFTFNPTNCTPSTVNATLTSTQGASAAVSSPFQATGCASLPFKPLFTASTQAKTSKANGASLVVKIAQKPGEANIHKAILQFPLALPARLTTLQKACTAAQFSANPAGCPAASVIGTAKVITPILNVPVVGPAFLVSHGGAAFPDVEFVLQANERGGNVTVILDGATDIKKGITYSKFETAPDVPITSFETTVPQGPFSVLATNLPAKAKGSLCGASLNMPTTLEGQNGALRTQTTKISVTGCSSKPTIKVKKAKVKGKTVLLTITTSQKGTVTTTGKGLKNSTKLLSAGTHALKLPLTNAGQQQTKLKLNISLQATSGTTSKAINLKT